MDNVQNTPSLPDDQPEKQISYAEAREYLTIPTGDHFTAITQKEGEFIHRWIREHHLSHTLEIGLAFGASAVSIMSAHSGRHITIDPYQQKNYQNAALETLETLGFRDRLVHYEDFSHQVLPKLAADKQRYDFVFIDGDHRFDHILVDFFYIDMLLEENGYVIFHDSWMRSTQLVTSFIRRNRKNYRPVSGGGLNMLMFQKAGKHQTPWDHFREFYTLRGMVSQQVVRFIIRLTDG